MSFGRLLLLILSGCFAAACSPSRQIRASLQKADKQHQYHTGFSLYDPETGKNLVSWQDNRYFNPASNTKIYTLYACLKSLPDSLPGLQFFRRNDTLFFQGTGDPSLFHPDLPESGVTGFLRHAQGVLCYSGQNFSDERYGPGWAWDDYNEWYQTEKASLPLYGNFVRFTADSVNGLRVAPSFWGSAMVRDDRRPGIFRDIHRNVFHYSPNPLPRGLLQDIPFRVSDELTVRLLSNALDREVVLTKDTLKGPFSLRRSIPVDTVYRKMMYDSDNTLAEQLLYVYATVHKLPLNTAEAIAHAKRHYFGNMPDTLLWRDGSGMSRYNLFTPRSTVAVLDLLRQALPRHELLRIFPAGGQSGTIRAMFREKPPFVYAKSGSFSNNYNLSGYLVTKRGKLLIFSFMNNHFYQPVRDIKKTIETLLVKIHEAY